MLRFDVPQVWNFRTARAASAILSGFFALAFIPFASAQTYTLAMNKFQPFAIAPSQTAASSVILSVPSGQTSPGPVDLTCSVTAVSPTSSTIVPECQMSPPSVTPPGGATATVITAFNGTAATPGAYDVAVTATLVADGTTQTQTQSITVLAVSGQFNLSVSTILAPGSVPAGSGAQATISVNPVNSYSGNVTLSCSSVIPLVAFPPQCSFAYPPGSSTTSVAVSPGVPGLVTLTISTTGPATPPSANSDRRLGLWLPAPLALLGLCAIGGKRPRRAAGLLAIFMLGAFVLLMPACNKTSYTTPGSASSSNVTPNNTYTITLLGTDQNGNISSNAGTPAATLSLAVTAPTN